MSLDEISSYTENDGEDSSWHYTGMLPLELVLLTHTRQEPISLLIHRAGDAHAYDLVRIVGPDLASAQIRPVSHLSLQEELSRLAEIFSIESSDRVWERVRQYPAIKYD